MTTLPVGIIGAGHLGSLHAKMFAANPAATLVGVYDIDPARSAKAAQEYHTRAYASVDDLLQHVKAATIATPAVTHCAVAKQAIERGVHIFLEKPIAGTLQEADEIVRLAAGKKIIVQVGHIERFNAAILALEDYRLDPMFIESHRLAQFNPRGTDVAVVLDLMIHDIDLILSLVNSEVEKIEANGVPVVSDSVDIANARIQFRNGCVANVTASRISQKKMRKMRLFQRDAYISIDFSSGSSEVYRLVDGDTAGVPSGKHLVEIPFGGTDKKIVYEQPEVKEINALKYELEQFVQSVQTGKQPVVTAEAGARALRIADEIMKKIGEQKFQV